MAKLKLAAWSAQGSASFSPGFKQKINGLCDVEFFAAMEQMPPEEFLRAARGADFWALTPRAYPRLSPSQIASCKNLKAVSVPTTGMEWINLDDYLERGIQVVNVPGFSTDSCAEFTFSLILR